MLIYINFILIPESGWYGVIENKLLSPNNLNSQVKTELIFTLFHQSTKMIAVKFRLFEMFYPRLSSLHSAFTILARNATVILSKVICHCPPSLLQMLTVFNPADNALAFS